MMLNVSETVRDIDIVIIDTNRDLHMPYSMVTFRMTQSNLEWLSEIFNDMKHRTASLRQLSFLLRWSRRHREIKLYMSLPRI